MSFRDPLKAAHARISALEGELAELRRGGPSAGADRQVGELHERLDELRDQLRARDAQLAECQAELAHERIEHAHLTALAQADRTRDTALADAKHQQTLALTRAKIDLAEAERQAAEQRLATLEAEYDALVQRCGDAVALRAYCVQRQTELEARRVALQRARDGLDEPGQGEGGEARVQREIAMAQRQAFDAQLAELERTNDRFRQIRAQLDGDSTE